MKANRLCSKALALLLLLVVGCGECGGGDADSDDCTGSECEVADCDELGNCRSAATGICYTPCKGPLYADDGTLRACSPEGLMEGCLSDAVCDNGTCVPRAMIAQRTAAKSQAAQLGSCAEDVDCPDHQLCLDGKCSSGCESTSDCAPGAQCVRTVCRQSCTEETPCSAEGFVCVGGTCRPTVPASNSQAAQVSGSFSLSVDRLDFSGGAAGGSFEIVNETSAAQVFTVVKTVERVAKPDGLDVVRSTDGEAPLPWVTVGSAAPTDPSTKIVVPSGESVEVVVSGVRKEGLSRWTGELSVEHEILGAQTVALAYSDTLDGKWSGRIYTFGSFDDGARPALNAKPLDDWIANKRETSLLDSVPNAFLQVWGRFRNNGLSLEEWRAILSSTLHETWRSQRVAELCADASYGADAVCAPFGGSGETSVLLYSSAGSINRVPSGIVELDFAMDIRQATTNEVDSHPKCNGNDSCFVGRIDSENALQFGGNPELVLTMDGDPASCSANDPLGCLVPMATLDATIGVGGRYVPEDGETTCDRRADMKMREVPWLVRAFAPRGVKMGIGGGQRSKVECRDSLVPLDDNAANIDYAAANPVPDGRPRVRKLSLVDALVFEQSTMLMLVREELEPLVPGTPPLVSYAYIALEKQPGEVDPATVVGSELTDDRGPVTRDPLALSCPTWLVEDVIGRTHDGKLSSLTHTELRNVARAAVRGDTASALDQPPDLIDSTEAAHYLCVWTEAAVLGSGPAQDITREVFNAGPAGTVACPPGSRVIYFVADTASFPAGFDPAQEPCNQTLPEQCGTTLSDWAINGRKIRLMERDQPYFSSAAPSVQFDLAMRCSDPSAASCDTDRLDLTLGKDFLAGGQPDVFFSSIETEIRDAFAYRTQFASRTGRNIGFAPDICDGGANLTPYCYDPELIERLIARVDCAVAIYDYQLQNNEFVSGNADDLATLATLQGYLDKNFAQLQSYNPDGDPVVEHGFERLLAELLIMLGDDAYVSAFASRFDLAGQAELAFEGDRFEDGGILLSGGAGYEMYTLYQATQYHEMVLDRFYRLVPALWRALQAPPAAGYVSQRTVTSYLERVTRASTQNAAAWSEIAKRYQALNRPDLARRVVARAYTRSHQESTILAAFMTEVQLTVSPAELAQVITAIEDAQRRYRVAMLEMSQAYGRITNETNFFGLPPDLVPFPALDDDNVNGFEVMFERARESSDVAADFEAEAIAQRRDFDTDAEAFQSELVGLRLDYEEQLGVICGTFIGDDGRVYPAIVRYAHLDPDLAKLDDPCGAVGNGELWLKAADLQTRYLELQRVQLELRNSTAEIKDVNELVAQQCKLREEDKARYLKDQKVIDDLQGSIDSAEGGIAIADRVLAGLEGVLGFAADGAAPFAISWGVVAGVHLITTAGLDAAIRAKEKKIRDKERAYEADVLRRECDYLRVESVYTVRAIERDMDLGELDILDATWNIQGELSEIQRLNNERQRLEAAWADSDQLAINIAAASNDPNIRIYKNDAIISSDRTFERALRDAYRATRIYEYYTASSYADFEKLFLVRLVNAGDQTLAGYLDDLEESFFDFEDQNGNPDTRVMLVSMKDDVLKIPRYSGDGLNTVLTTRERTEMFREKLGSTDVLDEDGFVSLGFSTTFDATSPLTANHKILFIEAEMFGQDLGDNIGRLYLKQQGTGVVRPLNGDDRFFAFPPATAVMNPVLNGDLGRSIGQDSDGAIAGPGRSIYRSLRFRDRPLVQTQWELVFNQRSESVNKDINLAGLDDIVLTIFYTDFTFPEDRR